MQNAAIMKVIYANMLHEIYGTKHTKHVPY